MKVAVASVVSCGVCGSRIADMLVDGTLQVTVGGVPLTALPGSTVRVTCNHFRHSTRGRCGAVTVIRVDSAANAAVG